MKRADERPSVAATEPRKVEIVRGEKSKKILDTQHSSFLPDPYRNPCNVERDRQLLGLLSQTAYAAILKTFQALFDRADVRPGCVVGYVLMK
jgi:hypothetical protein